MEAGATPADAVHPADEPIFDAVHVPNYPDIIEMLFDPRMACSSCRALRTRLQARTIVLFRI